MANLLTAPLFVLFFQPLFVKRSNPTGAWLALISSIAMTVLIAYSKDFGIPLTISFVWMTPCPLLVSAVVGIIASAAYSAAMTP